MTKRLAIIDGKSVFYRGYYSMPTLATKDGTPTGGVYGFTALSFEVIKRLKPDYVAVAWDKPKTNIRRRRELYPRYKAGRKPAPPDFYTQIPILHDLLKALGWPLYEFDDYEADDIMGALAVAANKEGIEADLITSDLDMLQLVGPLTHVYAMKKGFTNIDLYNPENFEQKYGLRVDQYLDLKSLKGDSSDNIPGVPGIGEKTAIQLLQEYHTLDGVYENLDRIKESVRKKLEAGRDSAYLSKEIARIWVDAPIPEDYLKDADVSDFDRAALKKLLTELEFRSLIRQMGRHLDDPEDVAVSAVPDVAPAKVTELNDAAKANIAMADQLVAVEVGDAWILSHAEGVGYRMAISQAAKLLAGKRIIAHDAKAMLRKLLDAGSQVLPQVGHDTRIGHFLLNSLERSRSLAEVSGVSLDEDDGRIAISAVWRLYSDQRAKLAGMEKLSTLASDIEFPTIEVLARMEHEGIRLDSKLLGEMSGKFAKVIAAVEQEIYEHAGYEFNIGSPSQLADVLFGKLQLSTVGVKKGKTGYSTGAAELDKLRGSHPIIDLITKYREYTKLKSTYIDALPKLVDAQGKLHTTFALDVAATGRLSSHDPNLQNIPIRSEIGRDIRKAFVPADGHVFVSADYSQFELRLAAILAGDDELVEDFNSDVDIHAKTASDVYGVPLEQVSKDQRRDAKVINFGVLYGMSPHGLSAATGMSFAEAREFIRKYFELRAPIRRYIDETLQKAESEGYVETYFGRRRPTPDVKSSNWAVREGAKRAAVNMPIQGTEADLMKLAMIEVDKQLQAGTDGQIGKQILQIHDSILIETTEDKADEISRMLTQTMENICPELGVKLKVDVSIGRNWGEL